MNIPLVDLAAQYRSIKPEVDEAIARVVERGQYVAGPEVERFEDAWARYCGAKYAVGVSSCSDALYLTLVYARDGWGDTDVWTTPMTFWATTEAALRAGLDVRYRDIDGTGCISPSSRDYAELELPVNLYGYPAPISVAERTVEDAAHSHGIPLRGWAASYSFYPTKPLGAMGQAGAVVTNDPRLAQWVRMARAHSEVAERFRHVDVTGNMRMDTLQAAVLLAKLPHLVKWTTRRRKIAQLYREQLAGLSPLLSLLPHHPQHIYHIYGVRLPDKAARTSLADWLHVRGIQTGVRYPIPLHLQPAMHGAYKPGAFPQAEAWADQVLNLPIHEMLTDEQVLEVVKQVRLWCEALDPPRLKGA